MIEQAKEELLILETQHPSRFDHLKLELKSFISQLESQSFVEENMLHSLPTSAATTQASSTIRKKRKKGDVNFEAYRQKYFQLSGCDDAYMKRRDRNIEAVIEKAQVCLHKIKLFKTAFF